MTSAAITLASVLAVIFVGALIADWWEARAERLEHGLDDCPECRANGRAHVEPPSRLDTLDGVRWDDPWMP